MTIQEQASSSTLKRNDGQFEALSMSDKETTERSAERPNPHDVEVKEILRHAQKDTNRVHAWRIFLLILLSSTAVAISVFTYNFMREEEHKSFRRAFGQFSRTIKDAALSQQHTIRNTANTVCNLFTVHAKENNMTWPFFRMPAFESLAQDARRLSGVEIISLVPRVRHEEREAYEEFITENYMEMVHNGYMIEKGSLEGLNPVGYHPFITQNAGFGVFVEDVNRTEYFPTWLFSPPPSTYGFINWNLAQLLGPTVAAAEIVQDTAISPVRPYVGVPLALSQEEHDALHDFVGGGSPDHPHSFFYTPVFEDLLDPSSRMVGVLSSAVAWDFALRNLLPEGVRPISAVIRNDCNQSFTYEIRGPVAKFRGADDFHESKYDNMKKSVNLAIFRNESVAAMTPGHCSYTMDVYPTSAFEGEYKTPTPKVFVVVIAAFFFVIAITFFIFDLHVEGRYKKLTFSAARSNAIVTSLFPETIRDQLINQNAAQDSHPQNNNQQLIDSSYVADLFLETTVVFADIAGFTAWSSVREPAQVFALLEGVYMHFDTIARRQNIFKVETVGDCYVAAAGIPKPRKDHAVAGIIFAKDILYKMRSVTKRLEISLGPDTSDLALRIGIHSGPVTGGMLRGDRARFQLFGDTVNTASRMETTGRPGRIHISQTTARLLLECGKESWITERDDTIEAKGKGSIVTYWVNTYRDKDESTSLSRNSESHHDHVSQSPRLSQEALGRAGMDQQQDERRRRLIDWNVETLAKLLKQVVAHRETNKDVGSDCSTWENEPSLPLTLPNRGESSKKARRGFLCEVQEVIALPAFNAAHDHQQQQKDLYKMKLPDVVMDQLRDYVTCIEQMYRRNAFHNFEHASHVIMSVTKLMSRIVAPDWEHLSAETTIDNTPTIDTAEKLHDHTYGITSDPLTQFSCALAALIHDVDHTGVPNTQLIKENAALAKLYDHRSVAEQNSLELSWSLLMDERYEDLQAFIYGGSQHSAEYMRFRQLVVNAVMATDIADKELKELRNARWKKAFAPPTDKLAIEQDPRVNVNRKATIVIEHLIQASDVSHTMQHWHIYRKWNQRFFEECYAAYLDERAEKDPSESWYKGEIGFFDFYIIPLAKKLKDCGVFGKSSDEYLDYATHNREEWVDKGQQIVAEMLEILQQRQQKQQVVTQQEEKVSAHFAAPEQSSVLV